MPLAPLPSVRPSTKALADPSQKYALSKSSKAPVPLVLALVVARLSTSVDSPLKLSRMPISVRFISAVKPD